MVVVGGAVGAVVFLKFKKPEVYSKMLGSLGGKGAGKSPKVG